MSAFFIPLVNAEFNTENTAELDVDNFEQNIKNDADSIPTLAPSMIVRML